MSSMIPELERAIRAIVRDEVAKALGLQQAARAHSRVGTTTRRREGILQAIRDAGRPLTSREIATATNAGADAFAWEKKTIQIVFTMKRAGLLTQFRDDDEYTYTVGPKAPTTTQPEQR